MKTPRLFLFFLLLNGVVSMAQSIRSVNLSGPGFDATGSDVRAVQIADAVMSAMGGRGAWNDTQLITWTFDGIRKFVWDKWSGDVRIDNRHDDQTILLNINNDKGRVFRNGDELTNSDSVAKYVRQGKQYWINDSYWLLLPFRLKDPGVTLKYLGDEITQVGKPADALLMMLKSSSNVPGAKYKLWIDKKLRLLTQWSQYQKLTDQSPRFTLPWDDYQQHGGILLSSGRGGRDVTDIMIFTGLPGEVFSDFTRTDLSRYPQAK